MGRELRSELLTLEIADERRLFTAILLALIILSWLVLWTWGQSPYVGYLDHGKIGSLHFSHSHSHGYFASTLFYTLGWTLMIIAMMLPTTLPLVSLFQKITETQPNRTRLAIFLLAGYLSTWMIFGFIVHIGYWEIQEFFKHSTWVKRNSNIFGAVIFLVAGVYQFTPLKYYCLDKCRSPFSFIAEHWRGKNNGANSFMLGVHHGIFCIGCCWSLMLLMFAVSIGNVGWMLILGVIMIVEKNMSWGRQISAPLGVVLLLWGLIQTAQFLGIF